MAKAVAVVALAVAFLVGSPQDPPQDPPPDAAALLRFAQLAQPGEPHALLQRLVGEWEVVVRAPAAPDQPVARGRMKGAALLGGRYVQLQFALAVGQQTFEAVQVLGFDRLRQQFTSTWRDDASTWVTECAGAPRADRPELLALAGTLCDAADPAGRPFRVELDLAFDQRITLQLFETRGGVESLVQSQRWSRQ